MRADLKPPVLVRVYAYAFLALWVAACLFGFVKALPHASAASCLAMLLLGSMFSWRVATVAGTN